MTIEIETTVVLASVEVNDEYGVTLRQRRKRVGYTPDEAEKLAGELAQAAADARAALAEITEQWAPFMETMRAVGEYIAHGFDLAPSCRDCAEGKHGACIGSAFVERGDEIDEVECVCSRSGHPGVTR